jgi:alkylation response protein AidB-like acyl-CoA dehydrogenase
MDFELTEEQQGITSAVTRLLGQFAGAKRARSLALAGAYDHELAAALQDAGFVEVAGTLQGGTLEAALVLEAIAHHAGLVAYGASALVAPALTGERLPAPIALAVANDRGPVRYGAHARTLLLLDETTVRVRSLAPGEARPVASNFGFPMAHVPADGGDRIEGGASNRLRTLWRVALAVELAGTMQAALELTVAHVKGREQFGRPIGTFQALQHRLAECKVLLEGSRWLGLEAAWRGADGEHAELAATHAELAAKRIFHEAHQLHGAMGLTREHDLFLWSMRLPALWVELDALGRRETLP